MLSIEKAHMVLVDKIMIKFTVSYKMIEKFADGFWAYWGGEDWISTKDVPNFFLFLLFTLFPHPGFFLIRYWGKAGIQPRSHMFLFSFWHSITLCHVHIMLYPGSFTDKHEMTSQASSHKQQNTIKGKVNGSTFTPPEFHA